MNTTTDEYTIAPTTHHPGEKGTSLYRLTTTHLTRLRTGSDPYPGRVLSRRSHHTVCRLSDERVKEVGLVQAFNEEQARYWLLIRLGERAGTSESGLINGHSTHAESRKEVKGVDLLSKGDDIVLESTRHDDDIDAAIDLDLALEKISRLPQKKRANALEDWHIKGALCEA